MAVVKVYNRDGSEYGTLNTDQYLFNNNLIGFEPVKLNPDIYPYIKINGIYYVNDGGEFYSRERTDNSAGLMSIECSYSELVGGEIKSPLKGLYFLKTVDSIDDELQIIGDSDLCGVVTLRNYRVKNKNLQSVSYKESQVDPNNPNRTPYRHKDGQKMLPISYNYIKDRYYWDFTPDQTDYFIFSNFQDEASSSKIEMIEVINGVVSLKYKDSFLSPEWETTSQWDLDKTPYITLCIKTTEQIFPKVGLIPVKRRVQLQGTGWDDIYTKPKQVFAFAGERSDNELFIHGAKRDGDEPPEIEVEIENEIRLIPLKLYNNMQIMIYPSSIKINDKTFSSFSNFNPIGYSDFLRDKFAKQNTTKEQKIYWNGNEGYYDSWDNSQYFQISNAQHAGDYRIADFSGYNLKLSISDYYIPISRHSPIIKELARDKVEQMFCRGIVYINGEGSDSYLEKNTDYEETYSNISRIIYSIKGRKGVFPSYISLLENTSDKLVHEYEESGEVKDWERCRFTNFQMDTSWPSHHKYWCFLQSYKNFWGTKHYINLIATTIGIDAGSDSIGVAIIASQKEDTLFDVFEEFSKNTCVDRTINSSSGNYIFTSNYGKKIKVICNLNDNSTREFYILPYATISTQLKEGSIADWDCEVVNED